ncbi:MULTISPECIES: DUF5753 domain-containing protein [unclassified Embleya]|uniref:DUF5753 domain-containing protein n=1 Tax=unclassified Embleya TaxID=2699296 RepID=UPI0036852E04
MKRSIKPGNPAFVAARHLRKWYSQEAFAEAYDRVARAEGIKISISVRQVRRWESANPPWPHPDARRVLTAMFGLSPEDLGFRAPYDLAAVERAALAPRDASRMEREDDAGWRNLLDDIPERLGQLIRLEKDAISLWSYETLMIPGLLQSPAYALSAAQMRNPTIPSSAAYERVRIRMQRSERLMRSGRPASFIVSEAALHQPIGGLAVLADQMGHLLALASQNPQVSIQMLPLDAAFVVPSPCLLLEMSPGRVVAWLEQLTGSVLVESPDDVMSFRAVFERLSTTALPTVATLERIDERRRALCTAVEVAAHQAGAPLRTRTPTTASRSRFWEPLSG